MLRREACSLNCSICVLLCFASAVAAWQQLPRNAAALGTWRLAPSRTTLRPREAAAPAAVVLDLAGPLLDTVAATLPQTRVHAYYTQSDQLVLLPVEPRTATDAAAATALRRHMEPKAWVPAVVENVTRAAGNMSADGKATSDHAMTSLAQALCEQLLGSRIAATVEAAPAKWMHHKPPQGAWKALLERHRVHRALAAEPAAFRSMTGGRGNPLERIVLGGFARLEPDETSRLVVELQRWCMDAQQQSSLSNDLMTVNVAELPVASELWDAMLQHGLRAALGAACGLPPHAVRFAGTPRLHIMLHSAEPPSSRDERCNDAAAVTVPPLTSYPAAAQGDQGGDGGGDVAVRLMSFYAPLALSGAEAAATLSLEIQDSGLRFELARGTGALLCSKLRHTVTLQVSAPHGIGAGRDSNSPREPGAIAAAVLCGTAHLVHPALRGDIEHWRDGTPAWHVDGPWLCNSEVLDRCWRVDPAQSGARALQQRSDAAPAGSAAREGQRFALTPLDGAAHRYLRQRGSAAPEVTLQLQREGKTEEYTMRAYAECPGPQRRAWFGTNKQRRICIGRAGFRSTTGSSAAMDTAIWELFGGQAGLSDPPRAVPVAPVVYVYVDPRYRGFGLGRRLFLACMSELATMGVGYAVITVLDNGGGGLLPFYEGMGYRDASAHLGRGADGEAIMLARLERDT